MDSSAYTRFVRNRALKSNTAVRTAPGVSQEMVVGRRTGGQALVLNRHVMNAECCSQQIVPPPPPIVEGMRLTFTPLTRSPGPRDITSNYLYVVVDSATGTITDNLGNSVIIDSPNTTTLYTLETFGSIVSLNFSSARTITIAGANDQIMTVEVFDIPGITELVFNGDLRDGLGLLFDPSTISSVVFHTTLTSLESLVFSYVNTTFTTLDVSKIPNITSLSFGVDPNSPLMTGVHEISEIINLSTLGSLTDIILKNCKFTELDLSALSILNSIYCFENSLLQSLNTSGLTGLALLDCSSNVLSNLDISGNTALSVLICNGNILTGLDVSTNTALTNLNCSDNNLGSLNVSTTTALTTLDCNSNQLDSLDISGNTALTHLNCISNNLGSLDISGNTALTQLKCNSNNLGSLDVSKNTALTLLYCSYNNLGSLDISGNTALTILECESTNLISLDISGNTALTYLRCGYNQLTSLNVSANTALLELYCSSTLINQTNADAIVTSLDINGQGGGTFEIINDPPYHITNPNTVPWQNLFNKDWIIITESEE